MKKLEVFLTLSPVDKTFIGTLVEDRSGCFFEYDPLFLESSLWLSPFKLPLSSGLIKHKDTSFGPLFGLFDDSLPDGWGLLLMDRYFAEQGVTFSSVSPLDRLSYIGNETMGALTYVPAVEKGHVSESLISLHNLSKQSYMIMDGDIKQVLPALLRAGGSPGGARPKILVGIRDEQIVSGASVLSDGFEHWLIKFFNSKGASDEGKIEYAYSLMAKSAGIEMPETRLFETAEGDCFFGVKRFDRGSGNTRSHVHTFGNLIHSNFRIPSCDYKQLLHVAKVLTKKQNETEMVFRVMIFNILSCNRDDHVKNFAFMLNSEIEWVFAPAYDLTFAHGPGGEHSMTVNGEGVMPTADDCLKLAELSGISRGRFVTILYEVRSAVLKWYEFAELARVKKSISKEIDTEMKRIMKGFDQK